MVMTALRTCEGISLPSLHEPFKSYLLKAAQPYLRDGELNINAGHLALTRDGIFISDMIMSDLMWTE